MRDASEARGSSVLKSMSAEEVQIKRSRGELSCAECRRCRIRCDRKLPCGSCSRRGVSSLCPNGSLRHGNGSRFVLADTEELHNRIAQMSQRIRQLEDALAVSHASESKERHPLLREDLLSIKFASDLHQVKESEEDISLSFGTLTLIDFGGSKYFGVSAGALAALLAREELNPDSDAQPSNPVVSPGIISLLKASSDERQSTFDRMNALRSCLPPHTRAQSLCDIYFQKCHFQPVEREELDDIRCSIYDTNNLNPRPHKAAVLFLVLAVAALIDPNLPPYNAEAETYCLMGMRALDIQCVSASSDMETVIALALLASYHGDSSKSQSLDISWSSMSSAVKLAQQIGLHRDPSSWNLVPVQVRKRRRLFWNLMFQDASRSLALGRPPTMSLSWVDCQIPESTDTIEDILTTYKYRLARDILWPMLDILQSTIPTNYATVTELDRKIREFSLTTNLPTEEQCTSSSSNMHWYLATQSKYVYILNLHRPFLVMALLQHPENPLDSPYAQSVLAAQSAASALIRSSARQFEKHPATYTRSWSIWIYLFGAAVAAGSIVSRAPTMLNASLMDLNLALSLFEQGEVHSRHAKVILPFIRQLKDNAYSSSTGGSLDRTSSLSSQSDEAESDISLYPVNAPILSSSNTERWTPPSTTSQSEMNISPPHTPSFNYPFSQPYNDRRHSVSSNPSSEHPFSFTPSLPSSPPFSHVSTPSVQGIPLPRPIMPFPLHNGNILYEDDQTAFDGLEGQWLFVDNNNTVNFSR